MNVHDIPYAQTGYFSGLILDYLNQDPSLAPFYEAFPNTQNFLAQADRKATSFSSHQRSVLVSALQAQYKGITATQATRKHIELLQKDQSFTITTGHQLSLLTGPLFFIFKIASTIKLCQQLKKAEPKKDFIPVYWMATEDHDFEEISHFMFEGKKFQWAHPTPGGAVGAMTLESLQPVLDLFEQTLPKNQVANMLTQWLSQSYRSSASLAEATRKLVNALFGSYGFVIVDGDDAALKESFVPYMQQELESQVCHSQVSQQIKALQTQYKKGFKPQVSPREINLFYLSPNKRQRIIRHAEGFQLDGDPTPISEKEMQDRLASNPQAFSPNVLLRPLYQEVILPNIGYIGGGGELAYWLQLKSFFASQSIPFPLLVLRNSAVLVDAKTQKKIRKLDLQAEDFFLRRNPLINKKIHQISTIDLDLQFLKKELEKNFLHLENLVKQTDASFEGAVAAQRQKQFNGIDHLEKRLLQAQKRKLKEHVQRIEILYESLFPGEGLQERQLNFSTFYLEKGTDLIPELIQTLDPLRFQFSWIEL
ncbi:MAG: bacillithiol biosynthesis cysteine-adding enzyme BshC [Flavobacteriaceae bacterium]|nr:bacillithiol biosynthesis cysteine-adding enzyme BshC [Flavobacteriaceae bacterium]